jgi:hypothetical protein
MYDIIRLRVKCEIFLRCVNVNYPKYVLTYFLTDYLDFLYQPRKEEKLKICP